MSTIDVAVIDLSDALSGDPDGVQRAAAALDAACRDIGFFAVTGHGGEPGLVDRVVDEARGFFRLDRAEKDRVAPPSEFDFRGYLGMDTTSLAATSAI